MLVYHASNCIKQGQGEKWHYLVIGGLTHESNISVRTMAKLTPHPSESNAHA